MRPGPALDWSQVRLLAVDVDGTLTPGEIYYDGDGERLKRFHTHDGHGMGMMSACGVDVAIITQESTPFTLARTSKLGIHDVHIGITDKVGTLRAICERLNIPLSAVAYVGDDDGDLAVMRAVGAAGGIPYAVADARPEVRQVAHFQCEHDGGRGAVRDVCDRIAFARA